jgi:drug/metabolite transporter (DMT)-like permease
MTSVHSRQLGWTALILAMASWGSVVVTIKIAARGLPVQTITLIEVGSAIALLGAVVLYRQTRLARPSRMVVLAGLLEPGVSYPLINAGLARTSGTHGAVIVGTESMIIVLLSAAVARRLPTRRILLAVLVTTLGAALVGGGEGGSASIRGDLLVAAGVVCAACYVLIAQRAAVGTDTVTFTFWQFVIGAAVIAPVTAAASATGLSGGLWGHPTAGQLAAALAAAVLGSAVAFSLYNWALTQVSTVAAGVSLTLIPVFGVAFSAALLSEPVTLATLAAAVAVIVGVVTSVEPEPKPPGADGDGHDGRSPVIVITLSAARPG